MSNKHTGSSIDDFLKEEGIFDEADAQAVKEVVAWQVAIRATLLETGRSAAGSERLD